LYWYSGVTVVLHCYSGVAVVVQWCQSDVAVLLQWSYNVPTVGVAVMLNVVTLVCGFVDGVGAIDVAWIFVKLMF
jgi:hypothetical protein